MTSKRRTKRQGKYARAHSRIIGEHENKSARDSAEISRLPRKFMSVWVMAPAQDDNERAGKPAEYSARIALRAGSARAASKRLRREIQPVSQRYAVRQRLTGRREMDIIELARQAGLQVLLDARIGSQTYHSVCGSLPALQRFAEAVEAAMHTRAQPPMRREAARRRALAHRAASDVMRRRTLRPTGCRLQPARPRSSAASPRARAT